MNQLQDVASIWPTHCEGWGESCLMQVVLGGEPLVLPSPHRRGLPHGPYGQHGQLAAEPEHLHLGERGQVRSLPPVQVAEVIGYTSVSCSEGRMLCSRMRCYDHLPMGLHHRQQ